MAGEQEKRVDWCSPLKISSLVDMKVRPRCRRTFSSPPPSFENEWWLQAGRVSLHRFLFRLFDRLITLKIVQPLHYCDGTVWNNFFFFFLLLSFSPVIPWHSHSKSSSWCLLLGRRAHEDGKHCLFKTALSIWIEVYIYHCSPKDWNYDP